MDIANYNQRRAAQERQMAARAVTDEARRMHLELAAIFEARAAERAAKAKIEPGCRPEPA